MAKKLGDWLDVATKLVAIGGIPIFIYQQYATAIDKKKDHTFEYVKEYRGEAMEGFRYRLSSMWDDFKTEIPLIIAHGGLAPLDRDELVRQALKKKAAEDKAGIEHAVYAINDFLDTVLICVRADHCDEPTARAYFADYAVQFYCLYGVIIRDRRDQLAMKRYGVALQAFVEEHGGC